MISVCLASHNGERFIKQQVESILIQLGEKDELIVSDDSSTDSTMTILKTFKDPRLHIMSHESSKEWPGYKCATLNFENALKHAKGDYIFLSDQDDVWLDNKIEVMMNYLKNYSYVVSDCLVTDQDLNIISDTRFTPESGITRNKYLAFLKSTPFQGSCAAFRREVLDLALPFPKSIQSHDRWIGFVASFYFNAKIIPEKLIYYRRHEGNVSTGAENKSNATIMERISNRLCYINGLLSILNRKRKCL